MSALDARIRKLAREEADPGRVAALEKEVVDLRAVVQRLDARLDAAEKAAGVTDQEERPAARRTRKTTGSE